MTEEKTRKFGKLKSFFKWSSIIIWGLILIALIYFQAPIKVIALIAIFYFANIFLKKPYLKYFWLTVLATVIVLVAWVLLPEDNQGWKPFTFDDEIQAINNKYAVPDNQNAALLYTEIFANLSREYFDPNIIDEVDFFATGNAWTADQYPELAQWLNEKQPLINKMQQAAKLEKCFYKIKDNSIISETHMNALVYFRQVAYLSVRKFNLHLGSGNIDEAIDSISWLPRTAKHLYQQPLAIDVLVGISLDGLSKLKLNYLLVNYDLNDEQLNKISTLLKQNNFSWEQHSLVIRERETLYCKQMMAALLFEQKDNKFRYVRDPQEAIKSLYPESVPSDYNVDKLYWKQKLKKSGSILMWFFIPSNPHEIGRFVDDAFRECVETQNFKLSRLKLNYKYTFRHLAIMNVESHKGIARVFKKYEDNYNGSLLLLAMRKYKNSNGDWPSSLDQLDTSDINTENFIYKTIDNNFILYTIGQNKIDDGGFRDVRGSNCMGSTISDPEKDDILIWPQQQKQLREMLKPSNTQD